MNPEQNFEKQPNAVPMNKNSSFTSNQTDSQPTASQGRLEKWANYIFAIVVLLAPIFFWPSKYMSLELVKTTFIVLGTAIPAIMLAIIALKERKIVLPPKSISWSVILLVASMFVSSFLSIKVDKSIIGQGVEIITSGFMLTAFVAGIVSFALVMRRSSRALIVYAALAVSFLITALFHIIRLFAGPKSISLNVFETDFSTLMGSLFSVGVFALVIAIISIIAVQVLSLNKKMKIAYSVVAILAIVFAVMINKVEVWLPATLAMLLANVAIMSYKQVEGSGISAWFKKIAWIPAVVLVIFAIFTFVNTQTVKPLQPKQFASYSENLLPWRMTMDVAVDSIKSYPTFGIGANHFRDAYLAFKPAGINSTFAWDTEFGYGFGLIPTLIVSQGFVGLILWVLFFVFFGICGYRALRNLPSDKADKFTVISSFVSSAFLWVVLMVYVPAHSIVLMTLVLTGIFFASAINAGSLAAMNFTSKSGSKFGKLVPVVISLFIVLAGVGALTYTKKFMAMKYFQNGLEELTINVDPVAADKYLKKAQALDSSDLYWQLRSEASLVKAAKLISTLTANTPASTTQTVMAEAVKITNEALEFSNKAIAYDKTNYRNYISQARVAENAALYKMSNGYEQAVEAYVTAIGLNPFNPSIYLSLARLQVRENKLDDAIKSIGAALQVKNDYLDAIFLLSQVSAAKGNLADAITAAKVAAQINPSSPVIYFQLGLLEYNNKGFEAAVKAFEKAVELQNDYANAKYFLGLSYARINKTAEAIKQFEDLSQANSENQEIALILSNLKAGKPIFADAIPPVTPNPEKRSALPINEKPSKKK